MFKPTHLSERYLVNENGIVISLTGYGGVPRRTLKQPLSKGYRVVSINLGQTKKTVKVHQLVARAFIPNPDNLPDINHKDGNKQNNTVNNLEWCTSLENIDHAFRIGLRDSRGEKNPKAKLTYQDVAIIKSLHKKLSRAQIAKQFSVSISAIERIHYGKAWL